MRTTRQKVESKAESRDIYRVVYILLRRGCIDEFVGGRRGSSGYLGI